MSDEISIAVAIFAILAEATAFVLMARCLNGEICSGRWISQCAGISLGIAAVLACVMFEIGWGFKAYGQENLVLLIVLLLTSAAIAIQLTALALILPGILAVIRWLKSRHDRTGDGLSP